MEPSEELLQKNHPLPAPEVPQTKKESMLDFLKFGILAVIIVIPIRLYIAQPFVVSGASMVPSFHNGNYLIIDEVSYRFEEPTRGEVIVFRLPQETSKFLIKRIAGLPSETIFIKGNEITIKNTENPEGFLWPQGDLNGATSTGDLEITLGSDEYFVLGDNRNASADSRLWGTLKRELIVGRPFLRLFPISDLGVFPGEWK